MSGQTKRVSSALGRALREARLRKGLTQEVLAEKAGCTSVFISNLENGHYDATVTKVLALEKAMGLPHGDLLKSTATYLEHPSQGKK
jgi:transcriptional regulator with XRE-family HTH domain